ncbi:MAG: glyoxylate/hydroxypyruvate reductase A [Betaproteobacteria bacterium]
MRLAFFSETDDAAPWRDAITAAIREIDFRTWPDVGDPRTIDCTLVWKPPAGWHGQFPNLKAIMSLGAGVDALLEDASLPRDVPITRMVDAGMGRQMAEYAVCGVLHFHRRMHEYGVLQRERCWKPLAPIAVSDYPVGILGLGVLGSQAARLLLALGFPVLSWTRTRKEMDSVKSFCGPAELDAFLGNSRVLVNFLPLTPQTRGMINRHLIAKLPRGACLINLARGGHVIESDVLAALDSGLLGGAMLDVFAQEPLPSDNPLWDHPGVVVTPHIAAVTLASKAADQVIRNLRRILAGQPLEGIVDRLQGY